MVDSYRALGVLAAHPAIDPNRVAVMGNSFGARGALYSSNVRFRNMYGPKGSSSLPTSRSMHPATRPTATMTRLPASRSACFTVSQMICFPLNRVAPTARLKQHGVDIELTEFPNAHHGYDGFTIKGVEQLPQARSSRNCHLTEGDDGQY